MSDSAALKRQLTIKTGVVKRLTKEEKTYIQEAEEQRLHAEKIEAAGEDEWNIKKQKEVLQDCLKMIPDCKRRLELAVADLEALLEGVQGELAESPEAQAAREALKAANVSGEEAQALPSSVKEKQALPASGASVPLPFPVTAGPGLSPKGACFGAVVKLLVLLSCILLYAQTAGTAPYRPQLAKLQSLRQKPHVAQCPRQPDPIIPSRDWRPDEDRDARSLVARRLSEAVKVPTVSYDDMGEPGEDPRWEVFSRFHDYLEATYPLLHQNGNLRKINRYGLLYRIDGSAPAKNPLLFLAHQDVVPVAPQSLDRWTHPPFDGVLDEEAGIVWGRGSSDDKAMLTATFSAIEQLLLEGWKPKHTIYIASGFDEEVGGPRGAAHIAEALREELAGRELGFIIDEGGLGIQKEQGIDVAMPSMAEKGYTDVELIIRSSGGHSSIPPDHTSIGILADLLAVLERHPHRPTLSPANPTLEHLVCLADALDAKEVGLEGKAQGLTGKKPRTPGYKMDRAMRRALCNPSRYNWVARRIAREGTGVQRYMIQTSQAIDVIEGGVKANALPEYARAVVNHRIGVESSVGEIQERLEKILRPVAEKKWKLKVHGFGSNSTSVTDADESWSLTMRSISSSEPASVSPSDSAQFEILAGTIRHIFPGDDGGQRLVTPVTMTGNTDTRHFLGMSRNVWRFNPNRFSPISNKHTVDERMSIDALLEATRFMYALMRNADEAKEYPEME